MEKYTDEEKEMIEQYREEYGIEPIDAYDPKYNGVLITGAVLATDPSLTENYKILNSSITSDKYYLRLDSPLATMQFKGTDEEKYVRAMNILHNSKVIIAEMSNVSTGQGMELQEATHLGIPILVIAKTGSKISGLVRGCPNVKNILFYESIYDIVDEINAFIDIELDIINKNSDIETKVVK